MLRTTIEIGLALALLGCGGDDSAAIDGGEDAGVDAPAADATTKPDAAKDAAPDVVVDQDPTLVSEGHDPQLEKTVSLALDDLKAHPQPEVHKPTYPNYHNSY